MAFTDFGKRLVPESISFRAHYFSFAALATLVLLISLGSPTAAQAQFQGSLSAKSGQNSKTLPSELKGVGIDQELNHQIPPDLEFKDETGKTVRLGDYFGQNKPIILSLVYFECPQLCPMVESSLVESLKQLKFDVGKQFEIITISFDPRDTPAMAYAKKSMYLNMYNRKGVAGGWHFLTGSEESIEALTRAVGFHYNYNAQNGQFAHATAIMILTPDGKLSRYFYGIKYPAGDLRLSLVEASKGSIGSPVDALVLYCCSYDVNTGKYGLIISHVLFLAALVTVVILGGFLLVMFRGGRRGAHA